MSVTAKASAAVMAVLLATTMAVFSEHSGQAATTACGSACTSPLNQLAGTGKTLTISIVVEAGGALCPTTITAAVLQSVPSGCGVKISMAATSSTNAGQDWSAMSEAATTGEAGAFVNHDALPPLLGVQYADSPVVEFQAAPSGVPTGLCLSLTSGTSLFTSGPGLGLSQCGQVSTSVTSGVTTISNPTAWILDQGNATSSGYEDLISGTSQSYSLPDVLTVSTSGSAVSVTQLGEVGGVVSAGQLWSFSYGASSAATLKRLGMQHT